MKKFRLLRADEIECRVQKCGEKGVSLLLYKTARTDADLLDETVGTENWENDFKLLGVDLFPTAIVCDALHFHGCLGRAAFPQLIQITDGLLVQLTKSFQCSLVVVIGFHPRKLTFQILDAMQRVLVLLRSAAKGTAGGIGLAQLLQLLLHLLAGRGFLRLRCYLFTLVFALLFRYHNGFLGNFSKSEIVTVKSLIVCVPSASALRGYNRPAVFKSNYFSGVSSFQCHIAASLIFVCVTESFEKRIHVFFLCSRKLGVNRIQHGKRFLFVTHRKIVQYQMDESVKKALLDKGYTEEQIAQYVKDRTRQANRENYEAEVAKSRAEADNGVIGAVTASAKSIPQNLTGGLGYLSLASQRAHNALYGYDEPLDYYTPEMVGQAKAQAARQTVSQKLEENTELSTALTGNVASFLYNTGMSMADSAAIATMAAVGVPPSVGTAFLGGTAATQATVAAKERGVSDERALLTGLAAGAAEALFEKVSLDKLRFVGNSRVAVFTKHLVQSAVSQRCETSGIGCSLLCSLCNIFPLVSKSSHRHLRFFTGNRTGSFFDTDKLRKPRNAVNQLL